MKSVWNNILRSVVAVFIFLLPLSLQAQSTKVKGRVIDASDGSGIPFAGIYFKNSTVGVSADMDGNFTLETRVDTLTLLSASLLGYVEQVIEIRPHGFNEVEFRLEPVHDELNAAVVKPDDSYMRSILRKIDEAKSRNDPRNRPYYRCDAYTKMELSLNNPDNSVITALLPKSLNFVYDYLDTSVVTGRPYLPVMVSESVSENHHQSSPDNDREIIKASRISGFESDPVLAQFTGNMHVKTNFYDNYLNLFRVDVPSPLSSIGNAYYDYYLIDSLMVDGRKTYKIRFHPSKWASAPTLDGEMSIDAEEFALRDIHARLTKHQNINWVRALSIDVENVRLPDSTWFFKQDKLFIDFSITMRDSSKMVSFLANRLVDYSNPSYKRDSAQTKSKVWTHVEAGKEVMTNDEAFWDEARPFPLSDRERGVYEMVDSIQTTPIYQNTYTFMEMLTNGWLNFNCGIGLGTWTSLYSFNPVEGDRVRLGIRTNKHLSKKFRVMGYAAYGFKDHTWKGGSSFEYVFNNYPFRKLTLSYQHDMMQLGQGSTTSDIVSSILAKAGSHKMSMVNDYALSYQHEWSQNFSTTAAVEIRRIYSNHVVPMLAPDGKYFNSIGYNQAHLQMRFSKEEVVTRGNFDRQFLGSHYPIVTLDLYGSMKGLGRNEYTYFRPEFRVDYVVNISPIGLSKINFESGAILGQVPYPMLKIFEGNGTYRFDPEAFACMDYFEFVSDRWVTLFWEHNFQGFFLGKIPLMKRLQWREVLSLRAAYGTISDRNNGIVGDPDAEAVMYYPVGMKKLTKPYVELGAGVTNIFRILRIDAFWRMTHRYDEIDGERVPHPNRFVLNIGFEFNF